LTPVECGVVGYFGQKPGRNLKVNTIPFPALPDGCALGKVPLFADAEAVSQGRVGKHTALRWSGKTVSEGGTRVLASFMDTRATANPLTWGVREANSSVRPLRPYCVQ
jgi:hypothetical protein